MRRALQILINNIKVAKIKQINCILIVPLPRQKGEAKAEKFPIGKLTENRNENFFSTC